MWKLVALASLALAFAFGGVAQAKCGVCIDQVTAQVSEGVPISTGGSTRTIHLVFSGTKAPEAVAPEYPTAVVMQIDGNRTKCITVALNRVADDGSTVTYRGTFAGYHASHGNHQSSYEGRVDVGGSVYEFKVPMNGTPGVIKLLDITGPPVVQPQVVRPAVTVAPVSQAVTVDETPAPAPGVFDRIASPDGQGVLLGIAVVSFLGATLLIERRRAGRVGPVRTESAIEA